jgi:hypothetical protein
MAIKHTFVSAKADGADATLVRPGNWNADHTIDPIGITETYLFTAAKYPVRLVATTNQASLSGNLTIDSGTTSAGDVVLLTAQTTASQNGPWIARAGTWDRPAWFPSGSTFSLVEKEHHIFTVFDGTIYAGSVWRSSVAAGATYTIDTTSLSYTLVKSGGWYYANGARTYAEYSDTTTPTNRHYWQSAPSGVIGGVGNTLLGVLPSGTAQTAVTHWYGKSDPSVDQAFARFGMVGNGTGGDVRIVGNVVGAGVQPSFSLVMNGTTRLALNTAIYDAQWGQNSTFPSYAATTNWMQMFLGNDAGIAFSTDTGAGKELDVTQNAYLDAGTWKYRESDAASQIRFVSGTVRFRYVASGTAGGSITWTTGMMMFNTGRVAIGSTTDDGTNALQVTGPAIISSSLQIGSTPIGSAQFSVTDAVNYTIAIGASGSGNGYVRGTSGTTGFRLGTNGTDMMVLSSGGASIAPTTDNAYTCGGSGARWSSVWSANGTIQTSDARQKMAVRPCDLGLDFINALRPVSFKFIVGGNIVTRNRDITDDNDPRAVTITPVPGNRTHYGLIAQEVKAAVPPGDDFGGYVKVDVNDPNSAEGLRYDEFVAPLIKAVQELSAKCDDLQKQVDVLRKGKLA